MSTLPEALEALANGRLVVLPTDTVYGLAARVTPNGIDAIFRAKGRPRAKPLPVLAAHLDDVAHMVTVDEPLRRLAREFWPGPLTVVARRAPGFDVDLGGEGEQGVAVRIPGLEVALQVLQSAGPLAITSANRSGERPPPTLEAARSAMGDRVAVYIDGGTLPGTPSTIVSIMEEAQILRTGALDPEVILSALRS